MTLKTLPALVPPLPPSGPSSQTAEGGDDPLKELADRIKQLTLTEREGVIKYLREVNAV